MPYLTFRNEAGDTVFMELGDREILIGRQPDCDLVFARRLVSRRHARLTRRNGAWILTDLGSSHGTFVNRLKITEKTLEDGDRLLFGDESVTYAEGNAPGIKGAGNEAPTLRDDSEIESSILAERPVESGGLLRTMLGARNLDVSKLASDTRQSLTRLAAEKPPSPDASTGDAGSKEAEAADASVVAGHLLKLVRIADEMRVCTDVGAVGTIAVQLAMRSTGASNGVLALRDGRGVETKIAQITAGAGNTPATGVRVSRTVVDTVMTKRVGLVAVDTRKDKALAQAKSVAMYGIRSVLCAPLWTGSEILGYLYLDTTSEAARFREDHIELISAIGYHAASEIGRLQMMERMQAVEERRKNLARFLSADVIHHIDEQAKLGKLDPTASAQEQDATILFADIQGFTALSERMAPVEVKRFLDSYLDRMTEILVEKNGGTLDKYIGDAIMALFGAPYSRGTKIDAVRAVTAAVEMRDTVQRLRAEDPAYEKLAIRIGVNTGKVVSGMIGSKRRLEYTVLGDAVNVASRLETTGEAGKIQIGEATYELVKDLFECEPAGERQVKNRAQAVRSWWVSSSSGTGQVPISR